MSNQLQIPLDNRLALCASFVREGTNLADVGTDHAYLPVKLAAEGKIRSAVACDVREGPLRNAEANILRFGVERLVRTVLSDGLDQVAPEDAMDVVMAGMGGELIAAIIQRTQWLYDADRRLILQPMTRAESLRLFLCRKGFAVREEKACVSGKKCYSVMLCQYDGKPWECGRTFEYFGRLEQDASPEAVTYQSVVLQKLKRKINGLQQSGRFPEMEYYNLIYQELKEAVRKISAAGQP